jgi:hypothetical protein
MLLSTGQFIVLGANSTWVALIEEHRVGLYYDGLAIAETRNRNCGEYVAQIVREFFGKDALTALPAPSFESLAFYMEHYEGRLQESVRQIAAVLLSGTLFNPPSTDGGDKVKATTKPKRPPSPMGATFIKSDAVVAGVAS